MSIGVEAPAREDLFFRDNDDKRIGAKWFKSDGVTTVTITAAELAFEFQPLPGGLEVNPLIATEPVVHIISSTAPGDPDGWLDADALTQGIVLATVPHGIWSRYVPRAGRWDMAAVSDEGWQRCLVRGCFVVEEGIAEP